MKVDPRLVAALLVLGAAPAAAAARVTAPPAAAEDELSLEELLERYKAERERLLEGFRARVGALVEDLESAYARGRQRDVPGLRQELVKLGSPVAPLLVARLEPGAGADPPRVSCARQVALALRELSTKAVTTELLALLDAGTTEGRKNALTVLAQSDDVERVGRELRARFDKADDAQKGHLLGALATLGGAEQEAFLSQVLADPDPQVVQQALAALTSAKVAAAAPRVLALLADAGRASGYARQVLDYYEAVPEVIDEDHCAGLMALVGALTSKPDDAVRAIELLARYHEEWDSKTKRALKDLSEASTPRVSEAALVALARDGDRSARKKVLEPYDQRLEENDLLSSAWEARANVRYRIGDYKNAIKDYTQALKTGETFGRPQPDVYVGLARCHALLGKEKDAVEWLSKAPISITQLRALAQDPDFAALVADERYRDVFRLESGD
ncbi:MAG: hypothetical protein H6828_00065 [Planctomycetes bacterium]|nr:hypothetical protein [Planctomycetota bacterium]